MPSLEDLKDRIQPKLDFNSELLIKLALLLRFLPLRWIYELYLDYAVDKKKVYNAVTIAKESGLIEIKEDITKEKLVILTQKGFLRASEFLPPQYNFKTYTKSINRIATIFQEHHYILFRFFLDYLEKFKTAEYILTDYDKNCLFNYGNERNLVKPDGIIRPKAKKDYQELICVESDTGTKTQTYLFDKLLRYFHFVNNNFSGEPISKIKVYFAFRSENRLKNVFSYTEKGNRGKFFELFCDYSLTYKNKRLNFNETLRLDFVFQMFQKGEIEIYEGVFGKGFEEYKKVDFWNLVLKANPKWAKVKM